MSCSIDITVRCDWVISLGLGMKPNTDCTVSVVVKAAQKSSGLFEPKRPEDWFFTTYKWQDTGEVELRHYCPEHAVAALKKYG